MFFAPLYYILLTRNTYLLILIWQNSKLGLVNCSQWHYLKGHVLLLSIDINKWFFCTTRPLRFKFDNSSYLRNPMNNRARSSWALIYGFFCFSFYFTIKMFECFWQMGCNSLHPLTVVMTEYAYISHDLLYWNRLKI